VIDNFAVAPLVRARSGLFRHVVCTLSLTTFGGVCSYGPERIL
jgi:hypothetical protein